MGALGLLKNELMIYFFVKRQLDIIFSFFILLFLLPIFLIIILIIKLDTSGPIFYLSERTGKNKSLFLIFKFRTMYHQSSKANMTTTSNDKRITSFGGFLRQYKLDELPQFYNVLIGDMSIVGPRPELPYYTDQYNKNEEIILSVRPGITDFASIEYYNLSDLIPENDANQFFEKNILKNKNNLRIKYVNEIGLLTDIEIIFKTINRLRLTMIKK